MSTPEQESVAKLQVQAEFMNTAITELKSDVKNVNAKLDNLLIEWQKFGGLYNAVTALQTQLNAISTWKDQVSPTLSTVSNSSKRLFEIMWYVIQTVTMIGVLYLLGIKKLQ